MKDATDQKIECKAYSQDHSEQIVFLDDFELHSVDTTPSYLHRKFIVSNYRVHFSLRLCLKSLFKIHNETFNIWTHLLALFVTIAAFAACMLDGQTSTSGIASALFSFYFSCAILCFAASSAYHLFCCHSPIYFRVLLSCDFFCISLLIIGSYIPGLYFGFRCHHNMLYGYLALVAAIAVLAVVIPQLRMCQHERWHRVLSFFFLFLSVLGCAPALNWLIVENRSIVAEFVGELIAPLFCYAMGFVFYITGFPERAFPGKFDIFLQSHQFWHICVFLGAVGWGEALLHFHNTIRDVPC